MAAQSSKPDVSESEMRARYEALKPRVEQSQRIEAGQAAALHYAALAYGDTMERMPIMKKASHIAQLVCIAAMGIFPIILLIRLAF